jgi:hypothetical protein
MWRKKDTRTHSIDIDFRKATQKLNNLINLAQVILSHMKRWSTLLIIAFVLPLLAVAQDEQKPKYAPGREKHRNKTDELGQKQGLWRTYNSLGDLMNEVEYVNDRRHGVSRRFYPYGKVMEEIEYQNGIKEGIYKRYFYSGQIKQEGEYITNKKNGKWTKYYEDGEIASEGSYKLNKRDGEWRTFNRKGNLINVSNFKDGVDLKVAAEEAKKAEAAKKAAEAKKAKEKGGKNPAPGAPGDSTMKATEPVKDTTEVRK